MRRQITLAALCAALFLIPSVGLADYFGTSSNFPPSDGIYVQDDVPVTWGQDYQLGGIRLFNFEPIMVFPWTGDYFSTMGGGLLSHGSSVTPLNGGAMLVVRNYEPGQLGPIETELVQLSLTGGPVWIKEDRPTTGTTSITDIGGGLYRIDSFFDVFTELSLDGGQSWIPSSGPLHVALEGGQVPRVAEPSTALLLGAALLGGFLRRRRQPR